MPNKIAIGRPPVLHTIFDAQDMLGTGGKIRTNSFATFSCGLLHIDTARLANLQDHIFSADSECSLKDLLWAMDEKNGC